MRTRVIAFCSVVATGFLLGGCFWASPGGIGVRDGRLKPCPDTPNCVSSREDGEQSVEPLSYVGSKEETRSEILAFLRKEYGANVKRQSDTYVHVTITTTLGFVDDLQFRFVPGQQVVHLRSASRVGRSDMGVNRSRIESLRKHLRP